MTFTLTYFPLTARGLAPLVCLETYGLKYTAVAKSFDDWGAMKASGIAPFGQLPILETKEVGVITQTTAIVSFIGRQKKDGNGSDAREKTVSDMLYALSDEYMNEMIKSACHLFNKERDAADLKTFWGETVQNKLKITEKFMTKADKFTSSGITTGEISLWSILHQMAVVEETMFRDTPKLGAFYKRILALPSVQRVLKGETSFGKPAPFFIKA